VPRRSIEDRFFGFVDLDGPAAARRPDLGLCWLWTGSANGEGYPQLWVSPSVIPARRVAWEIANDGPAPRGLRFETFACGRKDCVNPAHIRPIVRRDAHGRWLARLYAERVDRFADGAVCVEGHRLVRPEGVIDVPGGLACRLCLRDAEQARRGRDAISGPVRGR
jgi:hypothetical protein